MMRMSDEYYKQIKNQIRELVLQGWETNDIVKYYQNDIDDKKISVQAIYKYITEAKNRYIHIVLKKYVEEQKIPENSLFVLQFLERWAVVFQQETEEIFNNSNIKRKIIALEPYLKNLEKVYNMLEKIFPKTEQSIKMTEIDTIPLKGINESERN